MKLQNRLLVSAFKSWLFSLNTLPTWICHAVSLVGGSSQILKRTRLPQDSWWFTLYPREWFNNNLESYRNRCRCSHLEMTHRTHQRTLLVIAPKCHTMAAFLKRNSDHKLVLSVFLFQQGRTYLYLITEL